MKPFIYTYPKMDSQGNQSVQVAISGLQLQACPIQNLKENSNANPILQYLNNQMDFINSLHNVKNNLVYAIRYYSQPNLKSISQGKIEVTLYMKMQDTIEKNLQVYFPNAITELTTLINSIFPNHIWQPLDEKSFHHLWEPFPFTDCYIAEIRRREDVIQRRTMQPRPSLKRENKSSKKSRNQKETIYFVHNFIPQKTDLNRLLRLFLLHEHPLIFQVNLKPVRLEDDEEKAFQQEIAKCQIYPSQTRTFTEPFHNLHQRHAMVLAELLLNQLMRLQDAPFLMNIMIASPYPLPSTLLEAIGGEITEPVGLSHSWEIPSVPLFLQMGGYDVVTPSIDEQEIAKNNLKDLDFQPWGTTLAPQSLQRIRYMVDALEASGVFRIPIAGREGLPGLHVIYYNPRPLPKEIAQLSNEPDTGHLLLGENDYLGRTEKVFCSQKDRLHHIYIVGQTGTGKTTLLKTMILSDIYQGKGVGVIDPHGDLFDELLHYIPKERVDDVVIFDPNDMEYPVGLNLLEYKKPEERFTIIREFKSIIKRLIIDEYGLKGLEMVGPIFFQHIQMNLLLVTSNPADPGTLLEFSQIFNERNFWKKWFPPVLKDPRLLYWIKNTLSATDYTRISNTDGLSISDYFRSKFEDFLFDPRLRRIFGQKHSTINFRQIMDEGKILLVNLAKGEISEANSIFMGLIIMSLILSAAMSRANMPEHKRRTFFLYVDEFQSIATDSFTILLSEARKFGISLVLANQFISQIQDNRITQSIFGNVGTLITFRVSEQDARNFLAPQFFPNVDVMDLISLPNWHAYIKTKVDGKAVSPFLFHTILPLYNADPQMPQIVRAHSRRKYGRPANEVDKEIKESLKLPEKEKEDDPFKEFDF